MFKEGIYNIYVAQRRDVLLLSVSKKDKAFIYKNSIFFLMSEKCKITRDSLLKICQKTAINIVGIEINETGSFDINPSFFSDETVYNQDIEYITFPRTYIYANVFKSTGILDAWEQLMKEDCIVPAFVNKKKINIFINDNKEAVVFTNSDDANNYIKENNIEDTKPIKYAIGKARKHNDLLLPVEEMVIHKKTQGGI